ncbi:MAG: hypothetical protein K8T20_05130 [Planctomycetes bacterium]|nr:hypothetical protein [Planctomycetota bacterium]
MWNFANLRARAAMEPQYAPVAADYVTRYREGRPMWVNVIDGKIITRPKKGFCATPTMKDSTRTAASSCAAWEPSPPPFSPHP